MIKIRNVGGKLVGIDENGNQVPVDFESLRTESLVNVADHIVTSTSELDTAFNNLSQGETIVISQPDTPYRTTQWLDVDVSHVDIVATSKHAANGEPLIKVADGADVGGIRIGWSVSVTDVDLHSVGVHGNTVNQDDTVKRLHGIIVHQASDVTVEGCFVTRTHPYQEHSSGGTGIVVTENAEDIDILANIVDDAGDRSISVAGDDISVKRNRCINGFDRGISLQYQGLNGGEWYVARDTRVIDNYVADMSDGSAIKGRGSATGGTPDSRPYENIIIAENTVRGRCNEGVGMEYLRTGAQGIVIANNTVRQTTSNAARAGIRAQATSPIADEVIIEGNTVVDATDYGIAVIKVGNISISDNTIRNPTNAAIWLDVAETGTVADNSGFLLSDVGIIANNCGAGLSIDNNTMRGYNNWMIQVTGTSSNVTLKGNEAAAAGSGGIQIGIDASGTVAILNDLRDVGTTPIDDSGTGTITDPVNQNKTEDWNLT